MAKHEVLACVVFSVSMAVFFYIHLLYLKVFISLFDGIFFFKMYNV